MNEFLKKYLLVYSTIVYFILLVTCMGFPETVTAQTSYVDSLRNLIHALPEDTIKLKVYEQLSGRYATSWPDSSIQYAREGLKLASKLNLPLKQIDLYNYLVLALGEKGNFSLSIEEAFQGLEIAYSTGDKNTISSGIFYIAAAYFYAQDYRNSLIYAKKALRNQIFFEKNKALHTGFLGEIYFHLNDYDSALLYTKESYDVCEATNSHWSVPYLYMGKLSEHKGQLNEALAYYNASISKPVSQADYIKAYLAIAGIFKKLNNSDSSIYYAKQAYRIANNTSLLSYSYQASELLKSLYKQNDNLDSAFKYQELMLAEKDSLFNRDKLNQIQNIAYEDEKRQNKLRTERERINNNIKLYSLLAGLVVILIIVFIQVRNSRFKQKAYNLLQQQKSDIVAQKLKVEQTLSELKSTQAQLIQSEKMASLGELTAGIAHEIQNPLNFVNNFSEVNDELIEELREAVERNDRQEIEAILNDLKENENKIKHHGQRAEGIVKGMLMHSRSSQGQKEPTDINALADEYLRLAYHGMRAKDKSFNAEFKTDFDPNLPKINVVPQDIGRVLLNLINNAFYAVHEKAARHSEPEHSEGEESGAASKQDYKPLVTVSTKILPPTPSEGGQKGVEITVSDNGPGIPEQVRDKIFQPFFTTKPTGSGTGLGLSLSYDIIKAHGGEIKVDSTDNTGLPAMLHQQAGGRTGTEFKINLPTK